MKGLQRLRRLLMVISTNYGFFFILRKSMHVKISNENKKTKKYGIETISKRTPFLWSILANE